MSPSAVEVALGRLFIVFEQAFELALRDEGPQVYERLFDPGARLRGRHDRLGIEAVRDALDLLVLRKGKPERIDAVFTKSYRQRSWGGEESRSGKGSDTEHTSSIRGHLPAPLRELDVRIFLDAPCGDFNWMKQIDLGRTKYIGVAIVPEMIAEDIRKYRDDSREFRILDLTKGPVPLADLILCRDCLVHLSFRDSFAAIRNFKSSGSEYLLTTTFPGVPRNEDGPTGGWRPLNLELPPFLFPEPIRTIREDDIEQRFVGLRRSLGLWRLRDLALPKG